MEEKDFQKLLYEYLDNELSIFPVELDERKPMYLRDVQGNKISNKRIDWKKMIRQDYDSDEIVNKFVFRSNVGVATGSNSNGLIVLDFEEEKTIKVRYADNKLIQKLYNCTYVVKATMNRIHIYLKSKNLLRTTSFNKSDTGCEIKANGAYVLLPPSRLYINGNYHTYQSNGKPSSIYNLTSSEYYELQEVFVSKKPIQNVLYTRKEKVITNTIMEQKEYDIIAKNELVEYNYKEYDTEKAERDVIMHLLTRQISVESILSEFRKIAHENSFYKTFGDKADQKLRDRIKSIEEWRIQNKAEIDELIDTYERNLPHFYDSFAFTDFSIYCAFLKKARSIGSVIGIDFSVRDIAVNSGFNIEAVGKSIKRLTEDLGLLEITDQSTVNDAREFRLLDSHFNKEADKEGLKLDYNELRDFLKELDNDIFIQGSKGFGKNGLAIYVIIKNAEHPVSIKDIISKTKISEKTIKGKLTRFSELKIISKNPKLYSKGENFEKIKEVTSHLPFNGKKHERNTKFEEQRRAWHKKLGDNSLSDDENI